MLKKNKPTLKKNWALVPCMLYFFIHPQPNNIGPARQQPRALFLISLSLVGEGRGHSYCILVLRLLDYMGFAMKAKTEWKIRRGVGGGTHSIPTALGLGISAPTHAPKIPSLVWDWEGAQKCFILHNQTTGDLKSHHLQARATLTAMSVPHGHLFFLQNCR